MFASLELPELLQKARTLYTNARDDRQIADLLADPYEYTPADFDAGLALVEQVAALDATQEREYAEQYRATATARRALDALEGLFIAHRRLARSRHKPSSDTYRGLNLVGRIPDADDGLTAAADTFYRMLQADPTLYDGIRGLNPAAVTRGLTAVAIVRTAMDAQEAESGQAERATRLRDDAEDALRTHATELATVAEVALDDYPQLQESLGLLERS